MRSTEDFIEIIKTVGVAKRYQMVSFDLKALFTNVSLEQTVDLVLKRIYENTEISASITRNELSEILLLSTKTVHFTFRDIVWLQTDGTARGSPLGLVLTRTFMVYLERSVVRLFAAELSFQKRYMDDTITFLNIVTVDHILSTLNNFHPNI